MDQRQLNELMSRVAKLETLLEANDAYSPPGAVKLDDFNFGPGFDYSSPDYSMRQNNGGDPTIQYDQEYTYDPNAFSQWQNDLANENDSRSVTQSAIDDILARLNDMENLLSNGSHDTNQSGAQNAGAGVGDDGNTGSGGASGLPAGYGPISIAICDNGTAKTMFVLGTTPA